MVALLRDHLGDTQVVHLWVNEALHLDREEEEGEGERGEKCVGERFAPTQSECASHTADVGSPLGPPLGPPWFPRANYTRGATPEEPDNKHKSTEEARARARGKATQVGASPRGSCAAQTPRLPPPRLPQSLTHEGAAVVVLDETIPPLARHRELLHEALLLKVADRVVVCVCQKVRHGSLLHLALEAVHDASPVAADLVVGGDGEERNLGKPECAGGA